ncbi:MAG: Stp1/IreP family PP2C-type Ser/Thr phosphatase [Zetaproteobacteria bacterium]|nr:Stp1/IreP family PP2C-type Ser/Thr phosphatase [Zetaproteobacteria bacterium]
MSGLEMVAVTDVGVKRNHNEDFVGVTPTLGFAVLADGMGGHNAGEVASAMAVDVITRYFQSRLLGKPEAKLDEATGFTGESMLAQEVIATANNAIYEAAQESRECSGMGTTVVVAMFYDNRMTAAHVGDSRMYRLRGDCLSHVTEDHSLIQEQVRRGLLTADDARNSSIKNLVTRALGIEPGVEPDVVEDIFQARDVYLMCSDGLTDVVPDEAIRLTLLDNMKDLNKAAAQLIQLANDAGGPDNISVILIRTPKQFHRKQGFFSRLFRRR